MYSSSQKNGDVSVSFCPVQTEVKWPFMHKKRKLDEEEDGNGQAMERALNYSIVASMKKTPGESKKHRSIHIIYALSKRSHMEAIRVDWQHKVDRSSIVDFNPSRASITKLERQ